jgi:hypothetical protein
MHEKFGLEGLKRGDHLENKDMHGTKNFETNLKEIWW